MRLYLSYRRTDRARVTRIATALENLHQSVWWDGMLTPGVAFEGQLLKQLQAAEVFVAFVSRHSIGGIQQPAEVRSAHELGKPTLTVRLDNIRLENLPFTLEGTWIDAERDRSEMDTAHQIVAALPHVSARPSHSGEMHPAPERIVQGIDIIADSVRQGDRDPGPLDDKAVFVVHGHDEEMMSDVSAFLRTEGVEPIVLKKLKGGQNTLFDKFRTVGGSAKFAVILMSADDLGAGVDEYEEHEAGERALLYRARQNVILETGFFFGKLGWDNVFVLMKPAPRKIPRFERPSDLDGVIFETYDNTGDWKAFLRGQLHARKLI